MPKIKEMRDEANNALETCNMILRIGVSGFEKNKDSLRSSGFNDDGLPNKGNYGKAITGEIQYT